MRIATFSFLVSLLLASAANANDIQIGIAGPMTGGMAAFGEQIRHGAQLAVDEINSQGGLLGRKITLLVEDDACDPKQGRNVAAKLSNEKVAAVFGHWCTAVSMAASDVYAEEKILHIEIGALLSELTQRGITTLFRVSATDKAFANALGGYAIEHNPGAAIAIVTDRPAVTMALTKYMKEFFDASPDKLVDVEEITTGDKDFSSVIDKLRNLKPGVVMCACYTVEAGLLARQLREKDLDVSFYSWDTINSPDFLSIVGKDNTGKIVSVDYAHPPQNALYLQFEKEIKKRGWPMETQTAITYAAVEIFADAVRKAASLDSAKIAEVMHNNTFSTVLGDVKFAENGDRINPDFAAYQWVNGELSLKETLPH